MLASLVHVVDPIKERRQGRLVTTCLWRSCSDQDKWVRNKKWKAQGLVLLERMGSLQIAVLCPRANAKIQAALYWPDALVPN